ncbi:MAG TPA: hypothetical protein VHL77_11680 [Ferruginibacter sp.]|jgi:hypothetical protein|nr:hypothetical protein [Ferruginibacter sp.]
MKRSIPVGFSIFLLLFFQNCNRHAQQADAAFTELSETDTQYQYIKNYFLLSEQRKVEEWYNTYLDKCKQFYKIENPTKDTILNLIKSYWVTSDQQKHDIRSITWRPLKKEKEVQVTMNYSYRIIAEDKIRQIPGLKLQMILDRKNKVKSVKELSRGN